MITAIICGVVWIISITNGIIIRPGAVNQYATVSLTADSRGLNGIEDNAWKIRQAVGNTLNDWGLVLTLDSTEYGFGSGEVSSLSIEMCGECAPGSVLGQCDPFFAFSIGDQEYMIFATDLDSGLIVLPGTNYGSFVYPTCSSSSLLSGSPIGLIPDNGANTNNVWTFRDTLAGGSASNYGQLTNQVNGESFPLKFEFINDDISDTFTFRFSSPTFPEGLECQYGSALNTDQDFKLYLTPDVQDEGLNIKSFRINDEESSSAATVYAHTDNFGTYSVSRDGGSTYQQVYYEGNWRNLAAFTISDITSDTILDILVDDNIQTGGFIATIDFNGVTYSTVEPIEDSIFELISSTDGNINNLQYFGKTSSPWNQNDPEIDDNAKWIWNGNNANDMVFRFDFGKILNECDDIIPPTSEPTTSMPTTAEPTTSEPTPNPTPQPTTAEPTANPTIDGCDFDIDAYLEQCYCSNDNYVFGQRNGPMMGYQPYENYNDYPKYTGYNNGYNGNYDGSDRMLMLYMLGLSISLNFILVSYVLCSNKRRNGNKYEKVYVYSDTEAQ